VSESPPLFISVDEALPGGEAFTRLKKDHKNAREMENHLQAHSCLAIYSMGKQISQGYPSGGTER
jgi:hypothetical protein